jgi:hypothetical protein
MANFFDNDLGTIFAELSSYIDAHTPERMLTDIRGSRIDPNDLPSLGDQALMFMKQPAHSKVLYAEGVRQLEAAPQRLAANCNLFAAKRNLCLSCLMCGSAVDAFMVIAGERRLIPADTNLVQGVALALAKKGHSKEASWIEAEIRKCTKRTLRDLGWFVGSQARQPPDGLLDLDLEVLTKHGISATVPGNN